MKLQVLLEFFFLLDRFRNSKTQEGILNGWDYKENREIDTKKDLVQPSEKHLDGVPKFIQQPQSVYYVSKNKPVMITCIVQPVSHVNIFCADKQYSYMNEEVSPTGLIVSKLDNEGNPNKKGVRWKFSLEVRHKDVVEWFSEYKCYCEAWNQIEQLQRVKKVESTQTIIYESYINKQFKKYPKSQEVIVRGNLRLSCIPPVAKPPAEIHWLKNGEKITPKTHPQIEINDYGELLIANCRISDSGNYSCVATSFGVERLANAQITVLEKGEWTEWMEWTGVCPSQCSKKATCPIECSATTRQRVRFCKKSAVKKTLCTGSEIEYERCDVNCDSNLWTFWSEWSKCTGNPCKKERTRQCTTNSCTKSSSIESVNCTVAECGGSVASFVNNNDKMQESANGFINTHDIAMYVGLFVAVAVFLMVVAVIFCLIRRRVIGFSPNRVWRYSNTANGIQMFYPDKNIKKNLSNLSTKQINLIDINQPSLYRSMVLPNSLPFLPSNQSDASSNSAYTDVGNDMTYIQRNHLPSLPLIATPLLSSAPPQSMIRPSYSDSKVSSTLYPQMGLVKHISTLPIPVPSSASDHYQELGNTDNETSDQSVNEPCFPYTFSGENMVWATIDLIGGRINLPLSDISLTCPPNSFAPGISEQLFLASFNSDQDIPKLSANETLLSPVVVCGPGNVVAFKPLILTLPHCAHNIDSKDWVLSILTSYSPLKQRPYWQKFLDLEAEDSDSPLGYAHMTKDKLYLMTNQLQRFCLIGSSCRNKRATKTLRIAVYCTGLDRRHMADQVVVRVYIIPDISESLSRIHNFETNRLGARLITNQKQFFCEDEAGNISVSISDLAMEWQTSSVKTLQEIPFQDVWHSSTLHCSFTFIKRICNSSSSELKVSVNSLDSNWFCNLCIQQANFHHSKQTVLLSTPSSSSHTSISATSTQFSNYSAGGSQSFPYFVDDCSKPIPEPIFKLPEPTKLKLCKLLDSLTPLENDWRQLARHLSINNRSLQFFSNKLSSTEILLDLWEAENQSKKSVSFLIEVLSKMGRLDCVTLLEKELLQLNA